MRSTFVSLLFLLLLPGCLCAAASNGALLRKLDATIANKSLYEENKQHLIGQIKELLRYSSSPRQRYGIYGNLYREYAKYDIDSSMHYAQMRLTLARQMGSPRDIEESLLDLSETYIDAGMYTETVEVMSRLQASALHGEHLPRYYHIYRTVFNALANNCASNSKKSEYVELVDRYRDSLKMCLTPDDIAYLYVVTDQLIAEREYEAALSMLLKKYADPEVSVHEKAILAYSLGIAYRGIGDLENAERYLTISAINDLSTPIKEYQSLQELAFLLYNSGDIERAYNYINYAINDAIKFNIGKHFPFILRVLPTIVHSYEQKMKDKERQQTVMLWCIAVLLLFLCVGLVTIYAQKREIAKANRRQSAANRNLVSLNENLRRVNMQQSEMNEKLVESNRLKEVYVGYYMDICSDCIDSANRYRVSLNRIARNRGTKALLEELQTGTIIDDRIQAFYDDFDAAFLHIFPHFVEQFIELIVPEKRKFPKPGKLLNTELRVFALIRLGITDSNKIAKFLRYSVSTIYNCRVRMRNAAIDSRDNFEQQVMRLGLPTEEPPVRA